MRSEIYIVGPCAAESREQVMEIAGAISDLRLQIEDCRLIFRAGVWKPRTSPKTFQGAGDEALSWLQEVKATYGMPVATEVATPEHVEKALKAGIDYLWIGARTSANPIAVDAIGSAIADSISDYRLAISGIFIKNPVNADPDLWLGNIERIEKAVYGVGCTVYSEGCTVYGVGCKVYAIHRGCNHKPCWSMAHAVHQARPDIPMLLDPSHMSGDAARVPGLLSKVAELGLDGAMIEVHCDPESALSDRKQQITPDRLKSLKLFEGLTSLTTSNDLKQPQTTSNNTELAWLRAEIDELDEQLWDTIAARMDVSRRIGAWKKAHGVAPLQPERFQAKSEELRAKSEELRLRKEFIEQLWNILHEESLKQQ